MGDAEGVRFSHAVFVQPLERDPVIQDGYVPGYLSLCRLEFKKLGSQPLTGLRGNPVRDMVLANRRTAEGRPAQKIPVP